MPKKDTRSRFSATLLSPAKSDTTRAWAFIILPESASATLPRRGRTSVEGSINGHGFQATREPDGKLSHWLRVDQALLESAGVNPGELVDVEIQPVAVEPEPEIPADLAAALLASPQARAVWDATTTIARLDWIHWITTAKQSATRSKRIMNACDMLASGKRRVCCFDPSGYYSKAFSSPKAAD